MPCRSTPAALTTMSTGPSLDRVSGQAAHRRVVAHVGRRGDLPPGGAAAGGCPRPSAPSAARRSRRPPRWRPGERGPSATARPRPLPAPVTTPTCRTARRGMLPSSTGNYAAGAQVAIPYDPRRAAARRIRQRPADRRLWLDLVLDREPVGRRELHVRGASEQRPIRPAREVDVDNPTAQKVDVRSVSAVMVVAAVHGEWQQKVGSEYDAGLVQFSPKTVGATSKAKLDGHHPERMHQRPPRSDGRRLRRLHGEADCDHVRGHVQAHELEQAPHPGGLGARIGRPGVQGRRVGADRNGEERRHDHRAEVLVVVEEAPAVEARDQDREAAHSVGDGKRPWP